MKDDNFTIFSSILLGILQVLTFFGFVLMAFVAEPIAHSVRERCPECLVEFAGYYGQCIVFFVFTFTNLLSPCILHYIGFRKTLILSGICLTLYSSSFLYMRNYIYFPASFIAGIGIATYFCGASAYSAMQATSQTFSRNTSIIWMIGGTNNFISALFMILSSNLSTSKNDSVTTTPASRKATYRDFSESEIRILTLFMIGITFLAVILAFLLPNRKIKDSLYEKTEHVDSIKAQLVKVGWAMRQKNLLKLAPFLIFTGIFAPIYTSIYTTTVSFTDSLSDQKNLVAYVCMGLTIGEFIVGFTISYFNKRVKNFGLGPALAICCAGFVLFTILFTLFTPTDSSMKPTKEIGVFQPRAFVCLIISVLCGIVDGAMNNVRMTAAARALPTQPAIAFCVAKFYQAGATSAFFFFSSFLKVYQIVVLLSIVLLIGSFISFQLTLVLGIVFLIWLIRDLSQTSIASEELKIVKKKSFTQEK